MSKPEAIVFDIGRVLIHWDPEGFYDREIGSARRKRLFAEVPLEAMNLDIDRGAPFGPSVETLAGRFPEWAGEIRMWKDAWLAMASPDIPGTADLLRALRAHGLPVYALSNFGRETFELAQATYPVLTEFDGMVISGHHGVIKPEPKIYALVEDMVEVMPEALLFIDDRADNIAAAAARGWQTHLFEGPAGLSDRLYGLGLLPERVVL